jgi:hypothetical protein
MGMDMKHLWNYNDIRHLSSRRETCPYATCSPQISNGLTWDRNQSSAVRRQRLTKVNLFYVVFAQLKKAYNMVGNNKVSNLSYFYASAYCDNLVL